MDWKLVGGENQLGTLCLQTGSKGMLVFSWLFPSGF